MSAATLLIPFPNTATQITLDKLDKHETTGHCNTVLTMDNEGVGKVETSHHGRHGVISAASFNHTLNRPCCLCCCCFWCCWWCCGSAFSLCCCLLNVLSFSGNTKRQTCLSQASFIKTALSPVHGVQGAVSQAVCLQSMTLHGVLCPIKYFVPSCWISDSLITFLYPWISNPLITFFYPSFCLTSHVWLSFVLIIIYVNAA